MGSFIELDKNKAIELASNRLKSIQGYRERQKAKLIKQRLIQLNRPTLFKKLFGFKPKTEADAINDLSRGGGDGFYFYNALDDVDITYGGQELVCEQVIKACALVEKYIYISLDDLRRIS